MYCIGTGNLYIAAKPDNFLYTTEKLDEARLYSTAQRASNALVTLPRRFYEVSSKWAVREVLNPPEPVEESTAAPKQIPVENKSEPQSEAPIEATDEQTVDFMEIFNGVASLNNCKSGCLTKLNGELSRLNEEITDIEHYIEFSKLNVSDAYRAYKMLRDTLQERRQVKDNIRVVKEMYECCNVKRLAEVREELDNRVYAPRRLSGLFE